MNSSFTRWYSQYTRRLIYILLYLLKHFAFQHDKNLRNHLVIMNFQMIQLAIQFHNRLVDIFGSTYYIRILKFLDSIPKSHTMYKYLLCHISMKISHVLTMNMSCFDMSKWFVICSFALTLPCVSLSLTSSPPRCYRLSMGLKFMHTWVLNVYIIIMTKHTLARVNCWSEY